MQTKLKISTPIGRETVECFDDMNLKENLLRGMYVYGFERPSPIQQKGIKLVVEGRDTIAQSQSGTGKTATCVISALQIIEESMRDCQVLVLAPTRELAQKIHKVTMHLGDYMNIQSHACVGETIEDDIRVMQTGVQMVVGTPGRVNDMINRNPLKLDQLKAFILDDADEMLSRGFQDQIYDVFQCLPANVQVCLFSATMPIEILNSTSRFHTVVQHYARFMRDPVRILGRKEQHTIDDMEKCSYVVWDYSLQDWSRNKKLWTFGPELLDEVLNKTCMLECPQIIADIISSFCNFRYCFRNKKELRSALNMWCRDSTRAMSIEQYGYISLWDVSLITNMEGTFADFRDFNDDISGWDTSSATNMSEMFYNANEFNCDISGWDTSSVTNMSTMFYKATRFNSDISGWDTSSVTHMNTMFIESEAFNSDISGWDTSSVTNMGGMFWSAHAFNSDVSQWDTSSVRKMSGMFCGARAFNSDISRWDTSSVTNMREMFCGAHSFNSGISKWETSSVEDMGEMFAEATIFNSDISKWDTSSVTNMRRMFFKAFAFNSNISEWDTSSVTNMSEMFREAYVFNSTIRRWDTSSVEDMRGIFCEANTFNQNFDISGWDTSSVEDMRELFEENKSNSLLPVH